MSSSSGLHFKTYALILVMVIFGPMGDVLLSKGMKHVGAISSFTPANLPHLFSTVFSNGMIWLGISSLLAFFIAYTLVLSWADYSFVQPASSIAYGIVALLGYVVLGEVVTPTRWIGVVIICLGVLIVGHTPPRTTEHR
jgi:drug/metabolite transporter (DMT)-like permease